MQRVEQKMTYQEEAWGLGSMFMVAKPDEPAEGRTKGVATGMRHTKSQTGRQHSERQIDTMMKQKLRLA